MKGMESIKIDASILKTLAGLKTYIKKLQHALTSLKRAVDNTERAMKVHNTMIKHRYSFLHFIVRMYQKAYNKKMSSAVKKHLLIGNS